MENLSARIFPRYACECLVRAIQKLNGEIIDHCPVSAIDDGRVETPQGIFQSNFILLAHGLSGIKDLSDIYHKNMGTGVKGQAALFKMALNTPQIYADGVYIIPHFGGYGAVGSTSENQWAHERCDAGLDEILNRANTIMPSLKNAPIIEKWTHIRPKATLRDPILGALPNYKHLYCALGSFKIGFGLAPKIAQTIVECAMGNAPFIPHRFLVKTHLEKASSLRKN